MYFVYIFKKISTFEIKNVRASLPDNVLTPLLDPTLCDLPVLMLRNFKMCLFVSLCVFT